ncbi:hypothetical protein [Methylotenera versatilis]|uniref:hypothetical protein n=1 Tax=Methylotenera versatilis TaxID=1055487 RepID=UPI000648CF04|nr:hypothetical protein [Methylotenera versatilis]
MKKFIKENLVLVIGLSLPILLIVLFFLATVVPKSFGTPPQYELLFTSLKYEYENSPVYLVDFKVVNHQLVAKVRKNDDKNRNYNSKKLMAYNAKTETVREITIDLAKAAEAGDDNDVILDETKDLKIDASVVSPDGYQLEGSNYGNSGLVGGLFGGGNRNSGYRIKKGAVAYKVETTQPNYYYNDFKLVGWVVN